jgi:PhnB protein
MIGVEIDMVVTDSLKALELYEKIFDLEREEVNSFSEGQNEVIFSLYGVRFHMLDENPSYELIAPKPGDPKPIWFNVMVPNVQQTYTRALEAGCQEIQPLTEVPDFGVSNAIFSDEFGYIWMLHQVHREVSQEERERIWEEKQG